MVFALDIHVLGSFHLIKVSDVAPVNAEQIVELVYEVSIKFQKGLESFVHQRFNEVDTLRTLEVVAILCVDGMSLLIKELLIVISESQSCV